MSPSLEQTTTPELTPELQQQIAAVLSTYRELKVDADLLAAQMDEEKAKVYAILKDAGIEKTQIEEFKLTEVGGHSSKFDKQKFVTLGGDLRIYDQAVVKKPKKKYLKITVGDEKESDE